MLDDRPAERHRQVAGHFAELTRGAAPDAWDAPSPVPEWAARDVVRHLVTWFPQFLAGGSDVVLLAGPSVDDDPVEAWRVHADSVQRVLDDPEVAALMFTNPHTGTMPLAQAIDRFYTADIFLHTWDLARATGQEPGLDADFALTMVEGMEPMDEVLRSSGQYGPRVEVPEGSDAPTRLIGFIGRDPFWTAPA
ncbi:TIGR03086 family metal-binding protein [Herbiconiux solani]|uniref:TIGR03086 family metal-binding protein n=1 Tax=Herbiconiux solani TaxID=661329 RepID=UPI0009FBF3CC|nr:TIGR03086 family metal-binding protein [Herbiconiux solani]